MEQNVSKRRARKATIKNEIIKAAEEIFLEKGYRLASVDEVAERADVTKRTLYKHFPSKRALFIYMFDVHLLRLEKELSSFGKKAGSSPAREIIQNYRSLFNFTLKNEKFMRLYWMIDSNEFEGEIPAELVDHVHKMTNRMLAINESLAKKACETGAIIDVDPVLLVHLLSAINKGIFIHANKEKRFDIADIKPRELFDLLLVILEKGLLTQTVKGRSRR